MDQGWGRLGKLIMNRDRRRVRSVSFDGGFAGCIHGGIRGSIHGSIHYGAEPGTRRAVILGGVARPIAGALAVALGALLVGCAADSSTASRSPASQAAPLGAPNAAPGGAQASKGAENPAARDQASTPQRPRPDAASSERVGAAPPPTAPEVAAGAIGSTIETRREVLRQPWSFGEAAGSLLSSLNYRIHTTLADGQLLKDLPTLMEAALDHYTTALGELPRPDSGLRSYVFERRSEWAAYTRRRLPNEAETYLAIGRGGYTTEGESVLFNIGREDTFIISVHEGWHQYTQTVFADRLPTWFEEGIACYMEGHRFRRGSPAPTFLPWRNFERFGELRDVVRTDRLLPLKEMLDGTPQASLGQGKSSLLGYYAQSWAFIHFLNEGEGGRYHEALRQVLADAADGRLTKRLMRSDKIPQQARRPWALSRTARWIVLEYFNQDLDEFAAQYETFVRTITTSGSSNAIWRGESPLAPSVPAP